MRLRHFSFALCTTSWLLCFCANGQEPSAGAPSSAAARICAEVRQLTGDPLTGLRSADFAVSGYGAPLPFRLIAAGAQVPMSLLVIVSPAAGFHTLQAATASLTQIVPHRNQVDSLAFLGPRGEYVGFRPVDEALSNLRAGTFLYKEIRSGNSGRSGEALRGAGHPVLDQSPLQPASRPHPVRARCWRSYLRSRRGPGPELHRVRPSDLLCSSGELHRRTGLWPGT